MAAGDDLPQVLVGVDTTAALVDIGDLHGVADIDRAGSRLLPGPTIVLKSVVLPTPLGPMTPTMPLRGSVNDRSSMRTRSPKPLLEVLDLDHLAAQAWARRDGDLLEVELAGPLGLRRHLLIPARRALDLVWRALALERTHWSSSASRLASLASFLPWTSGGLPSSRGRSE